MPTTAQVKLGAGDEVTDNVKVYKSGDGVSVTLALVMPHDSKRALVEFIGTDTPLDRMVRVHVKENVGRGYSWVTQYKGRDSYTLRIETSPWGGGESITLYYPGGPRDGRLLGYDEDASKLVRADDLLARHLKQVADGAIEDISAFKRAEYEGDAKDGFDKVREEAEKACEITLEATINFASISDADILKYSIPSYCGSPLEAMRRLAGVADEPEKQFLLGRLRERVKRVRTHAGPRMLLTIEGGTLDWQTAFDATNMDDFCWAVLRNELSR